MEGELRKDEEDPINPYEINQYVPDDESKKRISEHILKHSGIDAEVMDVVEFADGKYATQVMRALELSSDRYMKDKNTPKVIESNRTDFGSQQTEKSPLIMTILEITSTKDPSKFASNIIMLKRPKSTVSQITQARTYQFRVANDILSEFEKPTLMLAEPMTLK